jgi:hypothetical protein
MSRAAKSILVFGVYLICLGATLLIAPNLLLKLFGMPTTTEVWIRVLGMLVGLLACYYLLVAREELTSFMRLSVYIRALPILFFVGFVMAEMVKPILILFGAIDLAGAAWTNKALHLDARHSASTTDADAE